MAILATFEKYVPASAALIAVSILVFWLLQIANNYWFEPSFSLTMEETGAQLLVAAVAFAIVYLLMKQFGKKYLVVSYAPIPISN